MKRAEAEEAWSAPPLGEAEGDVDAEAEVEMWEEEDDGCEVEDAEDGADEDEGSDIEEKESDMLGLAALQSNWETFSADTRSSSHCEMTHVSTSGAKDVLSISLISRYASERK